MSSALSIKDLKKTYTTGFQALRGISLEIQEGDFFALLGPNGAGKSTVIGIICSLINKTSGSVSIFDIDIDVNFPKAKYYLGIVPQEFNFSIFETPLQIVTNQAGYYGIPRHQAVKRAEKYLTKLGLWKKRNDIARLLSGGMKRRLMIARALVHEPRLLILDEPTAGIDIEIRHLMWEFLSEINQQGITIILTTHYLEEAENLCRNVAIIDHGLLVENTTIRNLLLKLHNQTYVLDIEDKLAQLPAQFDQNWRLRSCTTLEVDAPKDHNLNDIFDMLRKHNIKVLSMRNKSNRLEQFFLNLIRQDKSI